MIGQRFGRLTVKEAAAPSNGLTRWLCTCDCGQEKPVRAKDLKSGNTSSCGCLRRELSAQRTQSRTRHGHASNDTESPTYRSCSTWKTPELRESAARLVETLIRA